MIPLTFDVETAPLPMDQLEAMMPAFEPNANLKDPAKIEANLAEKRQAWIDNAALSAVSGRVLAIGILQGDGMGIIGGDDEAETLATFWDSIREPAVHTCIGFNIHDFDLPFLCQRSWVNKVPVPANLRKGRYWNDRFVDLMKEWACHNNRPESRISLDRLARLLGVGKKEGTGQQFSFLWANNREQAKQYLANDLQLTAAIGKRMGFL